MENFPINPEYCLILKALRETHSLREAALLLQTDAAHLTRKLQKFSENYDFVQKVGNKWTLTDSGRRLAQWVDESIDRQRALMEEKTSINITAFTWLAEEMLIPGFARLNEITGNKLSFHFNITSSNLEDEIVTGRTDYIITCHPPNDPSIAHKVFNEDPWFIVIPRDWEKETRKLKENSLLEFLEHRPFIRLSNLNPEQTLGFTPKNISELMVDGVIGCRSAVVHGLGWSCIPGFAIRSQLKRKEIIRLPLVSATRGKLSIWWLRSRKDFLKHISPLSKWLKEISEES